MYSYIEGEIVEKTPTYAVLDVNGVGYLLNVSLNTFSAIENLDRAKLYTHQAIKNEATTPVGFVLYGFFEEQERELFRHLISVSRVGASTAMLMLSSLKADEIYAAIINDQPKILQSVKGIGSKAAQRIIVELKDKFEKEVPIIEKMTVKHNTNKLEALSALTMLGFNKSAADKVLDDIIGADSEGISVEELIKRSLKVL